MVDFLILILFLTSGAITGWLCIDFLPDTVLEQVLVQEGVIENLANKTDLRNLLLGFGSLFGLLAGFFFQQLRKRLIRKIRTMPTDLLVSRSIGS